MNFEAPVADSLVGFLFLCVHFFLRNQTFQSFPGTLANCIFQMYFCDVTFIYQRLYKSFEGDIWICGHRVCLYFALLKQQ